MGLFKHFDKLVELNPKLPINWTSDKRLKSLRIFIKFLKRREKKLSEDEPLFEKIDELERVYNDLLKFYETHNSKYAKEIKNILKVEKLDIKAINKREKEVEPLIEQLEHVHRRISKKPLKLKDRKAVSKALKRRINRKIEIQGAHRINKEIEIEKKGELILLPGTELYLNKNIGITSIGKLTTKGTKQQPILITASNQKEGWKNIHIEEGKANINFTKISYGKGRKYPDGFVNGGGILISKYESKKSKVNIKNSTITKNTANFRGGGIYNEGELSITKSTISENRAKSDDGGGIYDERGKLSITNSRITGNTTQGRGGGIYKWGGRKYGWLSITSSRIIENTAQGKGGGICSYGGSRITITSSKIKENRANKGGGIFNKDCELRITNSTIIKENIIKEFTAQKKPKGSKGGGIKLPEATGRGIYKDGGELSLGKDCEIDSINKLDINENDSKLLVYFMQNINTKNRLDLYLMGYAVVFGGIYDKTKYEGIKPYCDDPKKYIKLIIKDLENHPNIKQVYEIEKKSYRQEFISENYQSTKEEIKETFTDSE